MINKVRKNPSAYSSAMGVDLSGVKKRDTLTWNEILAKVAQAKAEDIFKKQFERQADRILSKVYSNERMGAEEKVFVAGSKQLMEELIQQQTKLGDEAGLSPERTGQLANDIINRLTREKQKSLSKKGIQK